MQSEKKREKKDMNTKRSERTFEIHKGDRCRTHEWEEWERRSAQRTLLGAAEAPRIEDTTLYEVMTLFSIFLL